MLVAEMYVHKSSKWRLNKTPSSKLVTHNLLAVGYSTVFHCVFVPQAYPRCAVSLTTSITSWLRGSASLVLTVTGLDNGKFRPPPQNRHPLSWPISKNLSTNSDTVVVMKTLYIIIWHDIPGWTKICNNRTCTGWYRKKQIQIYTPCSCISNCMLQ